jgi:hypothetical protein
MKRIETPIVLALVLIGAGALFLLQNLGLLGPLGGLFWALAFAVGGGMFLRAFAAAPSRWWALIPGFTLLSLGALVGLQELSPGLAGPWGGALFLAGIGLGFCSVYLTGRARWWALIPGGAMLSVAAVAGLSETIEGPALGSVLFLGLGLTFGLVAIAPTPGGPVRWALFPAGILLIMALVGMASTGEVVGILWPIVLILAGLYLAYRAIRVPPREQTVAAVPAPNVLSDPHSVLEREAATLEPSLRDAQPLERVVGEQEALETAYKEVV